MVHGCWMWMEDGAGARNDHGQGHKGWRVKVDGQMDQDEWAKG